MKGRFTRESGNPEQDENKKKITRKDRSFSKNKAARKEGAFRKDSRTDRKGYSVNKSRADKPFRKDRTDRPERTFNKDKPDRRRDGQNYKSGQERSPRRERNDGRNRDTGRDYKTGRGRNAGYNTKQDHRAGYDAGRDLQSRPKRFPKSLPKENDGLIRLNKYISNAGIASRREADDLIQAGVISVNGEIVTTLGYKVKPGDVVKYNDEKLRTEKPVYLLLNKPKDYITTVEDTHSRRTVMSLVSDAVKERVYPIGRLDRNTTGLLLFTNDGDLAKKLTHPSFEAEKIYEVELDKNLKPEHLDEIRAGITLDDGFIKPDDVSYSQGSRAVIGIELHSGRNRIVRRIFEHFGYKIRKLDRVVYASLTKKNLPRGKWRFLTPIEIANLKMKTGKIKN